MSDHRPRATGHVDLELITRCTSEGAAEVARALTHLTGHNVRVDSHLASMMTRSRTAGLLASRGPALVGLMVRFTPPWPGVLLLGLPRTFTDPMLDGVVPEPGSDGHLSPMRISALLEIANIAAGAYAGASPAIVHGRIMTSTPELATEVSRALTDRLFAEASRGEDPWPVVSSILSMAGAVTARLLYLPRAEAMKAVEAATAGC